MYICTIGTRERSPAVARELFVLGKPATHFSLRTFSSGGHNESNSHPPVW